MSDTIKCKTTVQVTINGTTHDLTLEEARQLVLAIEGAIRPPAKPAPVSPMEDANRMFKKLRDEMEKANPNPYPYPKHPPYNPNPPYPGPWGPNKIYCQLVTP